MLRAEIIVTAVRHKIAPLPQHRVFWTTFPRRTVRSPKTKTLKQRNSVYFAYAEFFAIKIRCNLFSAKFRRIRRRICKDAIKKGEELKLPVYKFLEGPLVEKFGRAFFQQLY
ncbi:DUF3109 family protein [Hominenteromicrobium sp.]|uniref:DUF3109 family protein n=1 Tax=Hominenteromicrobium sp. TaxID=3073581 RepID=UPI003AF7C85D